MSLLWARCTDADLRHTTRHSSGDLYGPNARTIDLRKLISDGFAFYPSRRHHIITRSRVFHEILHLNVQSVNVFSRPQQRAFERDVN